MAWMAWDKTMSVGHAVLDSDHRILIDLINQLDDAIETGQSRDVVGSVLNVLTEYIEHHFRREEALMAVAAVPSLDGHAAAHRQLEERVTLVRDRYRGGERTALDQEVLDLLKKWLTEHILVVDKSYRPWLEDAGGRQAISAGVGKGSSAAS